MKSYPKCLYKNGLYRDDYVVVNNEDEELQQEVLSYSELEDTETYIYTGNDDAVQEQKREEEPAKKQEEAEESILSRADLKRIYAELTGNEPGSKWSTVKLRKEINKLEQE